MLGLILHNNVVYVRHDIRNITSIIFITKGENLIRNKIKKFFKKYGDSKDLLEITHYLYKHDELFIAELDSNELEIDDIIGQNVIYYLQVLLHRSKLLLNSFFISILQENFIALTLAIRAHFELTGALGYLLNYLQKYYKNEINYKEIICKLNCLILGKRDSSLYKPFESINILSMIDTTDKLFHRISGDKNKPFRSSYEYLSEFCHPNSYGLIFSSKVKEKRKVIFRKVPKLDQKEFGLSGYILISLPMFFKLYDDIFNLIKEKENIPKVLY